jgi:hypothetical protein
MRWNLRATGLAVLCLLLPAGRASADLFVFSDRALWHAAVSGRIVTEDFEQETLGFEPLVFPYTTAHGMTLDDVFDTGNAVAQILPDGLVNGSTAPHFRAFSGDQMAFVFPESVSAFGFDYFGSLDTWQVRVGDGLVISLPPSPAGSFDFLGVVLTHPTRPLTAFTFGNPAFAQRGISVDNVSFAPVPEPGTMLLIGAGMATSVIFRRRRRPARSDTH